MSSTCDLTSVQNATHNQSLCRALSVDLSFKSAPSDLMKKFVDTLVRLPNLRTLELLSVSHRSPVTLGLRRKCAQFPSIREMTVCSMYPDFIKSCPNLESLTFRRGFVLYSCTTISSYGTGLKKVGGVDIGRSLNVECEFPKTPLIRGNYSVGLCYSCRARLPET